MVANLQKPKKAVVIGETNLCVQCIKHLINSNWKVILVVSDDKEVTSWAKDNFIAMLPASQLKDIKEKNFYLFSVINPHLIPKSFLGNKNLLLALNYHDSPLLRYVGVNSTTCAIINNEKQYVQN